MSSAMATLTSIEWTEATWNPVRGCSRISPGCVHCYAERMAHRFSGEGLPYHGLTRLNKRGEAQWTGKVQVVPEMIEEPLRWKRPRMVFVNSMSDLFHERVPAEEIKRIFEVMRSAYWHSFQVLTKRPERCFELAKNLCWPDNVWMGTSVESADYLQRVDILRRVPAAVRFLSLEPLLGPIPQLNLDCIHWVIVGGESGPGARPMDPGWVRDIQRACVRSQVPFFFKQWGGTRKKAAGRVLDGKVWNEMPRFTPAAAE
jgi:protein gp37